MLKLWTLLRINIWADLSSPRKKHPDDDDGFVPIPYNSASPVDSVPSPVCFLQFFFPQSWTQPLRHTRPPKRIQQASLEDILISCDQGKAHLGIWKAHPDLADSKRGSFLRGWFPDREIG